MNMAPIDSQSSVACGLLSLDLITEMHVRIRT